MSSLYSVVDASWELVDPNPDIFQLFADFNEMFFWGKLSSVYVQWSPRMTLCAGVCKFHPRNRECSIHLSKPLLSYRPRKDLVETLLHEMIHAYLFMADNNRERESHGPKFHEHMYRINKMTGANITVYHTFHDEVSHFKTHWWKCNGPCQHRPPYFGTVKRSMNRAPGPNDFWFKDHQRTCGGQFIKIKEPSPKKAVKRKKEPGSSSSQGQKSLKSKEVNENVNKNKITNYFTSPTKSTATSTATATASTASTSLNDSFNAFGDSSMSTPAASTSNVEPFAGRGFVLGSIGNSTKPTSSGSSAFRNLFGSSSMGSSSTSTSAWSNASVSGKVGGTSTSTSQPPRRGDHPLLAKWIQNRKDPLPTSNGMGLKKTETTTRPTTSLNEFWDERGTASTLSNSSARKETQSSPSFNVKKKPPVEVIDLD